MKVLCVAEKPSIAKSVATSLGGRYQVRKSRNKYVNNYDFTFNFSNWGECDVTITSVMGHLTNKDFDRRRYGWGQVQPSELFHADITSSVKSDMESVAKNIQTESRRSQKLMIWTDCDREGENIGLEVVNIAKQGNRGLQDTDIKRARFNNTERSHIINAARNPVDLNMPMALAVEARTEIDLRVGAAFTRFQTKLLKSRFPVLGNTDVISYGTCQFPTLSFVVDRYKRVKSFEPEPFWTLVVTIEKDGIKVNFKWDRGNIFDRLTVLILYEHSLLNQPDNIEIQSMVSKPKSKWRPLPLTTVELQKIGSRYLKLSAKRILDIAEELYTKGFVSYPRTETDQFDKAMDLKKLVEKQFVSTEWGTYANALINEDKYQEPRRGKNNDNAHPPIHPVAYVARSALPSNDHYNVYKLIAQHFLACCSEDAKGMQTTVTAKWARQTFYASGLMVVSRNFLDVYPYTKWESSTALPNFERGEIVDLHSTEMKEGATTAPEYLTEAELIGLMDANGIGTDATMADHINTIIERQYVMKVDPSGRQIAEPAHRGGFNDNNNNNNNNNRTKRNTKGRRKGRNGADDGDTDHAAPPPASSTAKQYLVPSNLGIALIEGYENIDFDKSLTKPFLRKEMEECMKQIELGQKTKEDVLIEIIDMYRESFALANQCSNILGESVEKYLGEAAD